MDALESVKKTSEGRTLLTVGVLLWIAYILYKNNKQDMDIEDLKRRLNQSEQDLQAAKLDKPVAVEPVGPVPVVPVVLTGAEKAQAYNDRILGMLPARSRMSYNASGNATVSPRPTQVTINE